MRQLGGLQHVEREGGAAKLIWKGLSLGVATHVTGDGATIRTKLRHVAPLPRLDGDELDRANEKAFGDRPEYQLGGTLLPFRGPGLSVHLDSARREIRAWKARSPAEGVDDSRRGYGRHARRGGGRGLSPSLSQRRYGDDGGVCGRAGRSSSRGCSRCRAARPSPGPRAPTVPSRESRGRPPVERIATPETRRQRQAHWRRFSGPLSRLGSGVLTYQRSAAEQRQVDGPRCSSGAPQGGRGTP